ncbi:DUF58 domain-containing protein [Natrarchaeobaculum aegyptiacum]|uniref:Uncharacterized protein n=1 Tax=Natrarchaeobaculum aegyptiacum TaxID=745377 RepID=A0A2Z2HZR6_9EURY|nr:DUF58 domain-containing protein [Natrarchaeobaculum aegyptiacum]ARS89268.1 hypothetical protein B1756_05585 [Natrarchaeobaculum aegyptiacum]
MRWWRTTLVTIVGVGFVAVGVLVALTGPGQAEPPRSPGVVLAAIVFGLCALVLGLWKVWGRLEPPAVEDDVGDAVPAIPWSDDDPFTTPAPERTDREPPLSSRDLASLIETGGRTARREGDVDAGVAVVRPVLRDTLIDALECDGRSRVKIDRLLASGEWTDDPVAASVLEVDLAEPDRPFRERLREWLFPERAVRERGRRATDAVATAATDALPSIPGQTAPRTVPSLPPRLESLTRGVDGRVYRSTDAGPATGDSTSNRSADESGPREDAGPEGSTTIVSSATDSGGATGTLERVETTSPPRFRGAVAAALVLVVAALLEGVAILLLAALVPLAYVAYGTVAAGSPPVTGKRDDEDEQGLAVTRTIAPTTVPPGRPVTVTLEVTNRTSGPLADVRVIDGVPEKLAVHDGSPRGGGALEPGETLRLEYVLGSRRGAYDFDRVRVRVRSAGAGAVTTAFVYPGGDRTLHCRLDADAPPLASVGTDRVGQVTTDRAGEGISFHSTRAYRPEDPSHRIDWRHYAKRGTLATVSYEREVAASVVVVVDARERNRVVAAPGHPTAVELSAYAATRTLTDLCRRGHDVGLAVLGVDGDGPAGLSWLEPGNGPAHRSRALELLRSAAAETGGDGDGSSDDGDGVSSGDERTGHGDSAPERGRGRDREENAVDRLFEDSRTRTELIEGSDGGGEGEEGEEFEESAGERRPNRQVRRLLELTAPETQLAVVSPMLDDWPVGALERLRAGGRSVRLVSPDVIPENTVSGQYTQVRRRTRLARSQAAGVRTVDWRRGTPLSLVVAYAFRVAAQQSGAAGRDVPTQTGGTQ